MRDVLIVAICLFGTVSLNALGYALLWNHLA
jgi:hypothetical protein